MSDLFAVDASYGLSSFKDSCPIGGISISNILDYFPPIGPYIKHQKAIRRQLNRNIRRLNILVHTQKQKKIRKAKKQVDRFRDKKIALDKEIDNIFYKRGNK